MIFGQSRYLPDELKPVSLSARRQSHYLPDEMRISLRQSHYLADTTTNISAPDTYTGDEVFQDNRADTGSYGMEQMYQRWIQQSSCGLLMLLGKHGLERQNEVNLPARM